MSSPLDADQIQAIEIGFRGKLRALQISESFIERNEDDLIQQALTEYTRALEEGRRITNPGGWVVHTAAWRAIDQLRRERTEATPAPDEVVAEAPDELSQPPEEEALDHVEIEELHRAINRLSTSQRQALSLYYFEEKTTRESAKALGWSEPTFRRRRDSAITVLRKRFGVPVPEIEIGLAAWLSLTTGSKRLPGVSEPFVAVAESVRSVAAGMSDRGRDLVVRVLSSGGGESAIGTGAPFGRAAGVCATAAIACVASGVVGPGVGGVDLIDRETGPRPPSRERPVAPDRPSPETQTPAPPTNQARKASTPSKPGSSTDRRPARSSSETERARQASRNATSQFGVESSAEPASSATPAPAPTPPPAPVDSAPAPSPSQAANDQFGLP